MVYSQLNFGVVFQNSSKKLPFGPNFSIEGQQVICSLLFKFKNIDQYEN
jgi:hypothetical protein